MTRQKIRLANTLEERINVQIINLQPPTINARRRTHHINPLPTLPPLVGRLPLQRIKAGTGGLVVPIEESFLHKSVGQAGLGDDEIL